MTLAGTPRGILFPTADYPSSFGTNATMDATAEKVAHIGRLFINGRPGGTKTLSTGTIQFRTGACTWTTDGSTLDVGIQGVSGTGPIAQPNGTFTVKTTLTASASVGITANAWNTATMTSGTASLAHGDLIAVVWDMTSRVTNASVTIPGGTASGQLSGSGGGLGFPTTNAYAAGAWQTTAVVGAGLVPNVIIVFNDLTVGWIDFTIPLSTAATTDVFSNSVNPDERGMMFQVPWDCSIDGLWMYGGPTDNSAGFSLKLYSDPTGTPTTLSTRPIATQVFAAHGATRGVFELLPAEISLTKNTNYAVTCLATGTTSTRLHVNTVGNSTALAAIPGGSTFLKVTRDNSTGAFTAETPAPAMTVYSMGVRISQLHDTSGGGSSGPIVIGG